MLVVVQYSLLKELSRQDRLSYTGVSKKQLTVPVQRLILILPMEEQFDAEDNSKADNDSSPGREAAEAAPLNEASEETEEDEVGINDAEVRAVEIEADDEEVSAPDVDYRVEWNAASRKFQWTDEKSKELHGEEKIEDIRKPLVKMELKRMRLQAQAKLETIKAKKEIEEGEETLAMECEPKETQVEFHDEVPNQERSIDKTLTCGKRNYSHHVN